MLRCSRLHEHSHFREHVKWSGRRDLNPRHSAWEADGPRHKSCTPKGLRSLPSALTPTLRQRAILNANIPVAMRFRISTRPATRRSARGAPDTCRASQRPPPPPGRPCRATSRPGGRERRAGDRTTPTERPRAHRRPADDESAVAILGNRPPAARALRNKNTRPAGRYRSSFRSHRPAGTRVTSFHAAQLPEPQIAWRLQNTQPMPSEPPPTPPHGRLAAAPAHSKVA